MVLNTIGTLIENDLKDPPVFRDRLFRLAESHKARGVMAVDIELFSEIMIAYLVEVLGHQAANSLSEALTRLFEQFGEAFGVQDWRRGFINSEQ